MIPLNKGFTSSLNSQTWIATAGQTVFTITNGSYATGKNQIEVHVSGIRQDSGDNYIETNATSFTLSEGAPNGTKVEARWFEGSVSGLSNNHSSTHLKNGQDAIDITKLLNYDTSVGNPIGLLTGASVSNIVFATDSNGNVTGVQEKNGSTMLSNTTWTYNPDGTINTVTEVIGSQTIVSTFNYTNGKLDSTNPISRTVS